MSTATVSPPAESGEPDPVGTEPVRIGPSWQRNPDGGWLLPERTLGWDVLAWTAQWLQHPDGPDAGQPWRFTDEQARLVLWWYALDPDTGSFLYRDGILQRLKGWGKDPFAAALSAAEFVGPCRLAGWTSEGQPVPASHPASWVQIAAVSKDQTRNTMTLFPGLFTNRAIQRYGIDLGKEIIYGNQGRGRLEAVTSSPRSLEGARATFVVRNETHHWLSNNNGHEMAEVIDRNAMKSRDGAARSMAITNAYEPGEDSQAERDREAWQAIDDGRSRATGLLYDSLEASPEVRLGDEPALRRAIIAVRGDSTWLQPDNLVAYCYDPRNPPSRSRRFVLNQIVAAEDAWVLPSDIERAVPPDRLLVGPREPIVAFFDGSKSDDATGLLGCRLSDGHCFVIGVWQRPPGPRGEGWLVPRDEVDAMVETMFRDYLVTAFFADPSDARDDVGERFWESLIDDWHRRHGQKLTVWAVQSGARRHAVAWDMRDPAHDRDFTLAAMRAVSEFEAGQVSHDGHQALRTHLRNARRRPNRHGVSLAKEHRESSRKIDLAVCLVGARMLRRMVLNKEAGVRQRTGRVV